MLCLTRVFLVRYHTHHERIRKGLAMSPTVTYTPYATSSKEQTVDVIMFTQFEEGNLLTETRNDTESGDECGDESDSESVMMSE